MKFSFPPPPTPTDLEQASLLGPWQKTVDILCKEVERLEGQIQDADADYAQIRKLRMARDEEHRKEYAARCQELETAKVHMSNVSLALEELRADYLRKLDTLKSTEAQVSVLLAKNLALEQAVVAARMAEATANAEREVALERLAFLEKSV